jgi:hypothetical protein
MVKEGSCAGYKLMAQCTTCHFMSFEQPEKGFQALRIYYCADIRGSHATAVLVDVKTRTVLKNGPRGMSECT